MQNTNHSPEIQDRVFSEFTVSPLRISMFDTINIVGSDPIQDRSVLLEVIEYCWHKEAEEIGKYPDFYYIDPKGPVFKFLVEKLNLNIPMLIAMSDLAVEFVYSHDELFDKGDAMPLANIGTAGNLEAMSTAATATHAPNNAYNMIRTPGRKVLAGGKSEQLMILSGLYSLLSKALPRERLLEKEFFTLTPLELKQIVFDNMLANIFHFGYIPDENEHLKFTAAMQQVAEALFGSVPRRSSAFDLQAILDKTPEPRAYFETLWLKFLADYNEKLQNGIPVHGILHNMLVDQSFPSHSYISEMAIQIEAGSDTLRGVIQAVFYLLSKKPQLLEQIIRETDPKKRNEMLFNLTHLGALYLPTPAMTLRKSITGFDLSGESIKTGTNTIVLVNMFSRQKHIRQAILNCSDLSSFPEELEDVKRLPWGTGQRGCAAMVLSRELIMGVMRYFIDNGLVGVDFEGDPKLVIGAAAFMNNNINLRFVKAD